MFSLSSPYQRDLSRDSLCSDSPSLSRSPSQSSFTSLERLEIRHLIKTLKTKGLQSLNNPFQSTPISPAPPSQTTLLIKQPSLTIPKKSSITEELDQEFNKLRSANPNHDLINIKPSLIQKQRKSLSSLNKVDVSY